MNAIAKSLSLLKTRGPAGFVNAVGRHLLQRRLRCFPLVRTLLSGKNGLEIGGPSDLFARGGRFPLYAIVGSLDNCNFSRHTVWEGAIEEGATFTYDARHAPGRQYILEAVDLSPIPASRYDFVLASHTLEHVANPLRALREWRRTLKPGGVLVLVLPDKEETFDHRRRVTAIAHLIEDYEHGTGEDDLTHVPEILECHDLTRDPPAGDVAAFKARSEQNASNRCLHHHVFDGGLVTAAIEWTGLDLLAIEYAAPYHIVAVARNPMTR